MRLSLLFLALSLSLPACAEHVPSGAPFGRQPGTLWLAQATEGAGSAAAVATGQSDKVARHPSVALSRELLYKLLLAEVAGQRGNLRLAARAYLDMAQSTRDARLARRGTELAMMGRFGDISAEAASIWLELEPESQQARQALLSSLVGSNRVSDAKPVLRKMLAGDKARAAALFLQLPSVLARQSDKAAALRLVQDLAQPHAQLPEARLAVAQIAVGADNFPLAETEVDKALQLQPAFEAAALFKAQLLQRGGIAPASAYLGQFLAANEGAAEARLMYARMLAAERRMEEAREQFQRLERDAPANAEVVVMLGFIALQSQDFAVAEAKLKRGLELGYRDPDTLHFYLGQLAEEGKRTEDAISHYANVRGGDQAVPAAARHALLLGRTNRLDEARRVLQETEAQTDAQRAMLAQAEAQVLRDAKRHQEAFDVVADALAEQPDNPDLLYDVAMAAEKVDRLDVFEEKLKRLIEIKPEHAQAYNALGYTLADRNIRLAEARGYIEKALTLSPDDAFILDSMGWVHYRQGSVEDGLRYLQRAYATRPDPEIAAHLGEVLWVKGMKQEAERIWRAALADHPDSEELRDALGKFVK
jgi:tetratricopeptide (TPR) repeat protein